MQILKLLEFKRAYWKKKCTNSRMLLGEENTNFFQSIATESFRINTISSVKDQHGQTATLHEDKADFFSKASETEWVFSPVLLWFLISPRSLP